MVKKEPLYKLRKSTALFFGDKSTKYISKKYPQVKKDLEKSIVGEWKKYLENQGKIIKVIPSESPDFIVEINGEKKGLELCRLTSKVEEYNQAISSKYENVFKKVYGPNFHFEFLPFAYVLIPTPSSKEGKLIADNIRRKHIDSIQNKRGFHYVIINKLLHITFNFDSDNSICHPQPIKEHYQEFNCHLANKKWRSDYTLSDKSNCLLLLYRTGSRLDINFLRSMVNQLNKYRGKQFEEVWYVFSSVVPHGSIITKLFPAV